MKVEVKTKITRRFPTMNVVLLLLERTVAVSVTTWCFRRNLTGVMTRSTLEIETSSVHSAFLSTTEEEIVLAISVLHVRAELPRLSICLPDYISQIIMFNIDFCLLLNFVEKTQNEKRKEI